MSFKVNRIKSEKESYRTTVSWVKDFSKSANYLDRVRERKDRPSVEKFSTIEDKMTDIKQRIGFENVNSDISKTAGGCGSCGDCNSCMPKKEDHSSCTVKNCTTCKVNKVNSDEKLSIVYKKLKGLLKYVDSLIGDKNYKMPEEVMSHCRENPNLYFDEVMNHIDTNKFKSYISDKIGLPCEEVVVYTPEDNANMFDLGSGEDSKTFSYL